MYWQGQEGQADDITETMKQFLLNSRNSAKKMLF